MSKFSVIIQRIYSLTDEIVGNSAGLFSLCSGPNEVHAADLWQAYSMGFMYQLSNRVLFVPTYELRYVGNEIIIRLWFERQSLIELRVPSDSSGLDKSSLDRLRTVLLGRLEAIART